MKEYNKEPDRKNDLPIKKKGKKKSKKSSRGLLIAGIIIGAIQLIISAAFIFMGNMVGILPATYEILVGILLLLFVALTFDTQRWKTVGILTKILSVLLSIILLVGCVFLGVTHDAISQISGKNTTTSTLCIYVMADSGYSDIKSLDGTECGKTTLLDKEHTQNFMNTISQKEKINLKYKDYLGIIQLVEALYSGEVKSVIFNKSYLGILAELDTYKDFTARTRCIYTEDYVTRIETDAKEEQTGIPTVDDNVLAIYISGIDTFDGPVTAKANSDVNILCLVNTKTHQLFMINTPRDYYIPLSISNGVKDNLTH